MNMKTISLLILLPILFSGCDYINQRAMDDERADKLYRAAMEEYAAGRLDKSIAIFEKVLKAHPGNVSARFQLACLLQDHRKDALGAICNYREYVVLCPTGDKVKIANERMAICERQLATSLIKKYNLGGSVAQDEANARLRADSIKLSDELDATKAERDKLKGDLAALQRENARVRRMVLAENDDATPSSDASPSPATVKKMPELPDEKDLLEDDATLTDRVKFSADVANLIAEEKHETSEKSPFGKTVRPPEKKPTKEALEAPPHEPRPPFYVVQEGDTLFKLAMRFYGRRSAWTTIRDANKALISSDGRIKAGQKLRMP